MLVLPADHVIRDAPRFQAALAEAVALVDAVPSRLVTFGIRPTYPAESFGYLERGQALSPAGGRQGAATSPAHHVIRFREKPKADVAREYLASGNFFWNSGIFVWCASTILDALARQQPEMLTRLRTIAAANGSANFDDVLRGNSPRSAAYRLILP